MPYHHGNLRAALVDAAVDIAARSGPDAVAVRDVARSVGVSHNAAYRHFADRDALMRAVAAHALTAFGAVMARRIADVGDEPGVEASYDRFAACGRAYVEFAVEHEGLFATACSQALGSVQPDDADVVHPYEQLSQRLGELADVGAITPERRANAEIAAWSAVHGYATLLAGPLHDLPPADRERGLDEIIRVVRYGV